MKKRLASAASTGRAVAPPPAGTALAGLRILVFCALAGGLLALAPATQAQGGASQSLDVNFFVNGTISVTLPDGTPVGTTSGAPTVIPAGYYAVVVVGPGGCAQLPLFDLKGPGENIIDDMSGGEVTGETYSAYFLPNSTYTWRTDNVNPGIVHTFVTSAVVGGTPLASSATRPPAPSAAPVPTSQDLVGSAVVPYRGQLTAVVSSSGVLTLLYRGRAATSLIAGRYTITITDKSASHGFRLEKVAHSTVSVTAAAFVGRHSASIDLTAGQWLALTGQGTKRYPIVVSAGPRA